MRTRQLATLLLVLLATAPAASREIPVAGLDGPVTLTRDAFAVPTIEATTEHDALFTLGVLHARDRFFQIDYFRHLFSGTLAELLGDEAVASDVELRTAGLRRTAEKTLDILSPESVAWLEAYAEGVNAWLSAAGTQLPAEYAELELTKDGVAPWDVVDTVTISKGFAFSLSFSLLDLELTDALEAFRAAGAASGFDGDALFSEDLYRSAPFDPTVVIPGLLTEAAEEGAERGPAPAAERAEASYLGESTRRLIADYRRRAERVPLLARALDGSAADRGSNWWIAGPSTSSTGSPLLASDPHLDLSTPSIFYEARLVVDSPSVDPLDVSGVSFPGAPGIVLGCNFRACWGATVNPMDVTDFYQEEVEVDLFPPGVFTLFDGEREPVEVIPQTYLVNQIGDGVDDNLEPAAVGLLEGALTLIVPRRNDGPLLSLEEGDGFLKFTGLSVQYTGTSPTRELDAIRMFARATSPDEFEEALQFFDVGSQNWGYADVEGRVAYWSSAEMPLREDLQLLETTDGGVPPFIVRDGTGALAHEWLPVQDPQLGQAIPYEVLPFAEMPQVRDPDEGFIVSANNDPVGTTLDNDPLNELRPGGGIYYLNPGYATGFRAGRIRALFEEQLAGGGTLSPAEIEEIQGNNQLLDAEVLVPYLSTAFDRAQDPEAPPELAELGADPEIAEAIGRLEAWDFSTPTGIEEGWDPGDDPDLLPPPDADEIDASVAATIYSVWRGQAVTAVIDDTLARFGVEESAPGSDIAMAALRNLLDTFDAQMGVGVSGVDFFVVDGVEDPADERDVVLLGAVRDALDLLASDAFADAYAFSTDQDDYRWGKLHRITFEHPVGGDFSIPPAAGFSDLDPALPGLARAGGFGAVDASSHSARAADEDSFGFGSGPSRRFVGHLVAGAPVLAEVLPGGESGIKDHPNQGDQLELWLVNAQKRLPVPGSVVGGVVEERWVPVEE